VLAAGTVLAFYGKTKAVSVLKLALTIENYRDGKEG
jgi:hypothetical protein